MVWDLRGALLKKQEVESARLLDFEFRLRARTMRLLAEALGLEAEPLVESIALQADDVILSALVRKTTLNPEDLRARWLAAQAEARQALVAERGDPTPHRLA